MINIGIIKEYKIPNDYRVPFTPNQAKEIKELDGFNVVCQKSEIRCYKEEEYNSLKIKQILCFLILLKNNPTTDTF